MSAPVSSRARKAARPDPSQSSRPAKQPDSHIEGQVSRGFEAVGDAFAENFTQRLELGGACCVYYRGETVVDLWGGVRNQATGEPWQKPLKSIQFAGREGKLAPADVERHST